MKFPRQPNWSYKPRPAKSLAEPLAQKLRFSIPAAQFLLQRGLHDLEAINRFVHPRWDQLHDPFLMKGMDAAQACVLNALQTQKHIRIYGDYDVDGTTSVALLYQLLAPLAGEISYYIPDRKREGYGVSLQGIERAIQDRVALLICVDCGTRAIDLLQKAQAAGIQVIICDHHQPGAHQPNVQAFLNPKQRGATYPFDGLSACGVVFKLLQALQKRAGLWSESKLKKQLDLVALSIGADIVPMVDENRLMAALGLRLWQTPDRPICQVLGARCLAGKPVQMDDLIYGCAPQINAAGRMAHAHAAVQALIAPTKKEAAAHLQVINQYNQDRKEKEQKMTEEALLQLTNYPTAPNQYTNVLFKPGWHKGIVGIVASRCMAYDYKPTIVLTQEGGVATGSARSVEGFNICRALEACRHLLDRFGGHAAAAGLSLDVAHIPAFREALEAYAKRHLNPIHLQPTCFIDLPLPLEQLTARWIHMLKQLEPFGPGHLAPVFSATGLRAHRYQIYQKKHLKLVLHLPGKQLVVSEAIGFNKAHLRRFIEKNQPFKMAYSITVNYFQNSAKPQLLIQDIQPVA